MKKWSIGNTLQTAMIIVGIAIAVMLFLNKCSSSKNDNKELVALITAMNDTLRHYKFRDSLNAATITILQTSKTSDFLKIKTKDAEITALQTTVKEYKNKLVAGSSVTKALIQTVADLRIKTPPSIIRSDTIRRNDSTFVYPVYSDSLVNKWINLHSIMGKDSSNFKLTVNNEFDAVVGVDKKTKKPFVDLRLYNPYSSVQSLRTYQVSIPKPKKIGIGPNVSYGVGLDFKPQVFIGIGLQYSLIRF